MKLSEFLTNVGKPFSYYPAIARALGSAKACIFLCNLVWRDGDRGPDGKIHKTQKSVTCETGLSEKEQRTAGQHLIKLQIVEAQYHRLLHNTAYTVNLNRLDVLLDGREGGIAEKAVGETPGPEGGIAEKAVGETPGPEGGIAEKAVGTRRNGSSHSPKGHFVSLENKERNKSENKQEASGSEPVLLEGQETNELPGWLPRDAWEGWLEMRRMKKAPLTPHAIVLAIKKLETLRIAGHDPAAVLDQSTLSNWTGLFEVRKAGPNGNRAQERSRQNGEACKRAFERAEARNLDAPLGSS
ncbi:MAG: hypothetical protein ABSG54_08370 [Terriglobia bacterium]